MLDNEQLNLNILSDEFNLTSDLLKNKIILLTGASRGIGRACAKLLSRSGATVILLARTIKNLESLYDEIIVENLPTPAIYPFNLLSAKPDDYDDLRRNIDKNFGILDAVIHIAGEVGTLTPIEHYPVDQWFRILQTNLNAQFMLTKATLPLLKRSKSAKVIFTTNKVAKEPKAFWGAYAVANSGINAFVDILNQEYDNYENLNFYTVTPDKVRTSLYTAIYPGIDNKSLVAPEVAAIDYLRIFAKK